MLKTLALLLLPVFSLAADGENLTLPEYRKGLKELRGYFVKRGEDPTVADLYIADLESAFPVGLGERVPVTHDAFGAFLKYQAAWTRKTRDSKNPAVTPDELRHEVARARELKASFKATAETNSPRFYRAFQAAVKDVRSLKQKYAPGYMGTSAVFFSDQVDDSYTHVDAGDEALEKGDNATAIKEANGALGINPANADALVLKAAAEYDQQAVPAAVADAQAALILDPTNQQAQAILSLTSTPRATGQAAASLSAMSAGLASEGRTGGRGDVGGSAPVAGPVASATPAVGKLLAVDLSVRAMNTAQSDPKASLGQLGQAMALDPKNATASGWYATIANRSGDYAGAEGAAARSLQSDPNDALAYYNKAYAMAGEGNRDGMVKALEQAAQIDPVYRTAATRAATLDTTQALDALFGIAANARQPTVPVARHHDKDFSLMMMTGFVAAFLIMSGVILFFKSGPRPSVSRL